MKLFKKHSKSGISLGQYQLIEAIDDTDAQKGSAIVSLIAGKDVKDIKIKDLILIKSKINYLRSINPNRHIRKEYFIDKIRFILKADICQFSELQYKAFIHYAAGNNVQSLHKVLSTVLIPYGYKNFDDGYSHKDIQETIKNMDVSEALSIGFFLRKKVKYFRKQLIKSLKKQLKALQIQSERLPLLIQSLTINGTGKYRK